MKYQSLKVNSPYGINTRTAVVRALWGHAKQLLVGLSFLGLAAAHAAAPGETERLAVQKLATRVATELKAACPITDAASQPAFDACRKYLFGDSSVKQALASHVLWGRQAKDPTTPIKESKLTQFAPDIFAGMYLPIFMFDGTMEQQWAESEKLWRIKLGATVRNRLPPGQFPYPFWHEPAKWDAYENANAIIFWISPTTEPQIKVAQFTWQDGPLAGVTVQRAATPRFDGKWLWTDSAGHTQPAVTLFDGLYSSTNPYKGELETRYRELAIGLREGQCLECHVPNNPNGLKRLVLMQTPAHAAGEISRILKVIRNDRMPVDETGIESPLPDAQKQVLLKLGGAFESSVNAARAWEEKNRPTQTAKSQ